jgi:hypothetical protein
MECRNIGVMETVQVSLCLQLSPLLKNDLHLIDIMIQVDKLK